MGMIRVYLLQEEIRITYPLIIAITAISRLIILQKKDLDPSILNMSLSQSFFGNCNNCKNEIFQFLQRNQEE